MGDWNGLGCTGLDHLWSWKHRAVSPRCDETRDAVALLWFSASAA